MNKTSLSVNLNKVALVRNTRHLGIPSVTRAATQCLQAGASGITVHPRPDERHIRATDVRDLAELLRAWPERGVRYLASRFSAKEAFSKAIGLGMIGPMQWRLCESAKLATGKPTIVLHGPLKEWFDSRRLTAHVSLTDETDYAASFCVVEQI